MSFGRAGRSENVALKVILQPKSLIWSVATSVRCVGDVKLHQEASVLKAWLMKGHGSGQRHPHQLPFSMQASLGAVGDEEELVLTSDYGI